MVSLKRQENEHLDHFEGKYEVLREVQLCGQELLGGSGSPKNSAGWLLLK